MSRRQETKDDRRGNPRNRRARKMWMLSAPQFGGNGQVVRCTYCPTFLTYASVQADRIIPGGSYRRENVTPACGPCNINRSNKTGWVAPLLASATSAIPRSRQLAVA
jgi:5-methylcytosine-specific restriction endonuclease McrA